MAAISEVQEQIIGINPLYEDSLSPLKKLHVTLCCLGLDNQEAIQHAGKVLQEISVECLKELEPHKTKLEFKGVDHFFNRCLYAKVHDVPQEGIITIADVVNNIRCELEQRGVQFRNLYDFVPHLTIFKMSRQLHTKTFTHFMDGRLIELFKNSYFGSQFVTNIHLCEMTSAAQDDGFYVTSSKVDLTAL